MAIFMLNTNRIIEKAEGNISVSDFRNLLYRLSEERPDIYIRVRFIGDMWLQNFMSIHIVRELEDNGRHQSKEKLHGIILKDELENKIRIISELKSVIQFEIDKRFHEFQPYSHYTVTPFNL
jgi:hypothetical protein